MGSMGGPLPHLPHGALTLFFCSPAILFICMLVLTSTFGWFERGGCTDVQQWAEQWELQVPLDPPSVGHLPVALASVLSWFLNFAIKCDESYFSTCNVLLIMLTIIGWFRRHTTQYVPVNVSHMLVTLYKIAFMATVYVLPNGEQWWWNYTSQTCAYPFVCLLQGHHEVLPGWLFMVPGTFQTSMLVSRPNLEANKHIYQYQIYS